MMRCEDNGRPLTLKENAFIIATLLVAAVVDGFLIYYAISKFIVN